MRHLRDLVRFVDAEHVVACPRTRATDLSHPDPRGALAAVGARVHTLSMSRRVSDPANLRAVGALRALINETRPDVIHAHASVAGVVARLGTPRHLPVVWTPHALQEGALARAVERFLRRRTARVVALSASEAALAVETRLATAEQLVVIANGIETKASLPTREMMAAARDTLGVPQGVQVIGFIGRLAAQKRPLDFVAVAANVLRVQPDTHAVLVGSGDLKDEVLAAARGLPAERFRHVVCDDGASSLLCALDVLVSPSAYEGGPYLPLEAMHAGVPVVGSSCTGLRDYVVDHVSGFTAPVGDVAALSDAVLALLGDTALREAAVRTARAFLSSHHDIGDMSRSYELLYAELGANQAGRT
jgi:glycosyltransferase involved in cell wall biosynthesis